MSLLSPAKPRSSEKTWKTGTLTYTFSGLILLFAWLLGGDFAWSLKERSVTPVVQVLLGRFQITDLIVGFFIGSLPAGLTMLVGPIIAYMSDSHRGPHGRRIPFLLVTTPFIVVSLLGLAITPYLASVLENFTEKPLSPTISFLIPFVLFWTVFEFATIIANAVFSGLINDVVPRELMGRFYSLFRALSLLAGILFNFWLMGKSETYYAEIFIAIAFIYGGGLVLIIVKVKEGEYPEPEKLPDGVASAIKSFFSNCFGNSYAWCCFAYMTLMATAFVPINLFNVFFAKSIGMSLDSYGKCLALTYFCSLLLAYPLGVLADRFHPLRVGLVISAAYAVVTLAGGLLATDTFRFGFAAVAHGIVSGAWLTATASLPQHLFPRSRFAQYASAVGVTTSLGAMLIGILMGGTLDALQHDYRFIYIAAGLLSAVGLLSGLYLAQRHRALKDPIAES